MPEKSVDQEQSLDRLRHSTSHVMAQVVLSMFPNAKLGVGPSIEDGFYYDFDLPRTLTPEDLESMEKCMKKEVAKGYKFVCKEVSVEEARNLFKDQPYKLELIEGLVAGQYNENGEKVEKTQPITTFTHDSFVDLCKGPHLSNTKEINPKGIKLINLAGAYWRGDEKRPMLQRIYGTVWPSDDELKAYLTKLKEIERRDHRRLGKELELFSFAPEIGVGLVMWLPKGALVRSIMEDYSKKRHLEAGYKLAITPHIGRSWLFQTSGHLRFYKENMFGPISIENEEYWIKPMNCPFHIMIYKSQPRSYRDLPLRIAEFGTVYRYERSGTLHGLLRVRGFTQDDAHIFCRPDQVKDEILSALDFIFSVLRDFGFRDFKVELSVRDPANLSKYCGKEEDWQMAEAALRWAIEARNLPYKRMEGEAVFYGPKIDIKVCDAIGRDWQCGTVQFDFNMSQGFDLQFTDKDGKFGRPYMVHRVLFGSMERFFGILLEHYAGALPVWLAPVQAIIMPITDDQLTYAKDVYDKLSAASLRVEVDERNERLAAKIRDAQLRKIPYMLVVGQREKETSTVSVRLHTMQNIGAQSIECFIKDAQKAVSEKIAF